MRKSIPKKLFSLKPCPILQSNKQKNSIHTSQKLNKCKLVKGKTKNISVPLRVIKDKKK